MRYFWRDKIDYEILNDEVDAGWPYPKELKSSVLVKATIFDKFRNIYIRLRRHIFLKQLETQKLIYLICSDVLIVFLVILKKKKFSYLY